MAGVGTAQGATESRIVTFSSKSLVKLCPCFEIATALLMLFVEAADLMWWFPLALPPPPWCTATGCSMMDTLRGSLAVLARRGAGSFRLDVEERPGNDTRPLNRLNKKYL